MGWGTDFTTDIFLSKKTFNSKYELDDSIKEFEDEINAIKSRILMFASSNIKEGTPSDPDEEPIYYTFYKVTEEIKSLEENIIDLYKLNLYKETNPNFDKKQI